MGRIARKVDVEWQTHGDTHDDCILEVLMDIRAELRRIRMVLDCPNVAKIPRHLDAIRKNTNKPKATLRGKP